MGIAVTTVGILLAIVYLVMAGMEFIRGDDKKAVENVVYSILIVIVTWVLYLILIGV